MFDFYLIVSVIVNIFMFIIWQREYLFNLCIKILFLILSVSGGIVVINNYHLVH
jgi:hypothetical protein